MNILVVCSLERFKLYAYLLDCTPGAVEKAAQGFSASQRDKHNSISLWGLVLTKSFLACILLLVAPRSSMKK